ncbi:Cell division protein FtsZ [invertebrate metagenome]|uniref:Cell division protein FtsZ n=1 Tax=invertebrate metagenome TaxID=1711999 RepID=A0A484H4Y0_9ZZZZ
MIAKNLEGVDFIVANTDAQSLSQSCTDRRIQLGVHTTEGLGAGAKPEIGRAAAEEALEVIQSELAGSHMSFITAGMGGGTGTGAAPVIARTAREMGILTVGVVTKPFHFEGIHRMRLAEVGMDELARYVDTLIIIPNQNLFRVANERTTFAQAFNMADDVLYAGVRGVTDLILMPGLINLDFADIRTVMSEMGKAMMGTGEADGEKRALDAAEAAISNPLLDDTSMKGARGVLINITGGPDMTLYEVDEAANRVRDEVDPDANIIFGSAFDDRLDGRIRVSVVATGIDSDISMQDRLRELEKATMRAPQRPSPMPYMVRGMAEPISPAAADVTTTIRSEEAGKLRGYDKALPTETPGMMGGNQQRRSKEQPGCEHFATLRQAASRMEEAFIPAPAMEPQDIGSRPSSQRQANLRSPLPTSVAPQPREFSPQASAVQTRIAQSLPGRPAEPLPVRRAQTLLEKVAGIGRIRRTGTSHKNRNDKEHDIPKVDDRLSLRVQPENQPTSAIDEDLEIPAFLRRQAN